MSLLVPAPQTAPALVSVATTVGSEVPHAATMSTAIVTLRRRRIAFKLRHDVAVIGVGVAAYAASSLRYTDRCSSLIHAASNAFRMRATMSTVVIVDRSSTSVIMCVM